MIDDLYPRALGKKWMLLPEPVRACHRVGLHARGRFTVTHGTSWLAKLVAWVSRFPPAKKDVRLRLEIESFGQYETWTRHFDDHRLATTQYLLPEGRVAECQGPVEVRLRLSVKDRTLVYRSEGAAFRLGPFRIPLGPFAPRVKARAWAADETWMRVRVSIALPFMGRVLEYKGRLQPHPIS